MSRSPDHRNRSTVLKQEARAQTPLPCPALPCVLCAGPARRRPCASGARLRAGPLQEGTEAFTLRAVTAGSTAVPLKLVSL